jgi:STE24 endopeptidase
MGLPANTSLAGRMVILGFIASLLLFPMTPLSAWLSRRNEREADRFATDLTGRPQELASALIKMSAENLANLFPHPLYAAFHYSHPPVVERVGTLMNMAETEQGPAPVSRVFPGQNPLT